MNGSLPIVFAAMLVVLCGCTRSEQTNGLAEQVHKALDPKPQYVDRPAEPPREPQSRE